MFVALMKRQTKHLLLYAALLVLAHSIRVLIGSLDVVRYGSFPDYLLFLCPTLILSLVFGFMLSSRRQFAVYLLVTVIVWQVSFVLEDWAMGRLTDSLWLEDKEGTWGIEIFGRCIMPVALISVGALMGQLRRSPRLP
jgi:hypothetical protein